MKITKDKSDDSRNLREQAEKRAKHQIVEFRKQHGQETAELIHELRVHQIELEIQNEELRNTQLELAESRDKYCELYDFAPVGYFTLNKEGLIVGVNLAGAAFLGEERDNLLKSKFSHFITPDSQDEFYLHRKQVVESGARQSCEVKLRRKDGTEFPAQLVSVAVAEQTGEYDQFHMTITDITERKQAEEELRKEKDFAKSLVETAQAIIMVLDTMGRIISFNPYMEEISGYKLEEVLGFDWFTTFLPKRDRERMREVFKKATADIQTRGNVNPIVTKNGQEREIEWYDKTLKDDNGNIIGVLTVGQDITERKKAEGKLLEYHRQLKKLTAQLALTEECERRRIAGELHDHVGQSLALAKIKLDALRASATSRPADEVLADVSETLRQLIDETRSLTFDLSYPILYEIGFEAAVSEWLNEQVRDKNDIAIEFADDGLDKPLDDDIRVLLFRNVRELLINCIKHANAGRVEVSIRRINDSIEVTVEDNGIGFDHAEVKITTARETGYGLFSIRESLEEFGGRLEIESKPGAGCKAVMTAPLKSQTRKKEE